MALYEKHSFSRLLNAKNFNLSALLETGKFHLDEAGLLVAPDGIRYRLPSGPPEGRQPLRPHEPDKVPHFSTLEQQDSHKPVVMNSEQRFPFTPQATSSSTLPTPLVDTMKSSIIPGTQPLISIDWNVVLLTLILSSISLACNLGLLVMLSCSFRRVNHRYHGTVRSKSPRSTEAGRNCLQNSQRPSKTSGMSMNTVFPPTTWFDSHRQCSVSDGEDFVMMTHNHRKRRKPNVHPSNRKYLTCPDGGHCSSSENSCTQIASDGILSETTADEETSTEDSEGNSERMFRRRRIKYSRTKQINRRIPTTGIRRNSKQNYALDTIRSSSETSASSQEPTSSIDTQLSITPSLNGIYAFYSLGIHIGLLGAGLSLLQLIVVCTGLRERMTFNQSGDGDRLPELICVLASSLAADTLICARQYLISALLIVFWATFSVILFSQSKDNSHGKFFASLWNSLELNASVESKWNHCRQRCAYMALLHSLPWALAAGTALFVTFVVPIQGNTDANGSKMNFYFRGFETLLRCPEKNQILTSETSKDQNLAFSSLNSGISYEWISLFLLFFIPFLMHILICFIYTVCLRLTSRDRDVRRNIGDGELDSCKPLIAVFTLVFVEFISCAFPFLWSIIVPSGYQLHISSTYANRLILLHLLIDPLLIFGMLHSLLNSWNRKNSARMNAMMASRPSGSGQLKNNGVDPAEAQKFSSPTNHVTCLPLTNRTPTQANIKITSQPLLMSCIPNTNYFVRHISVPNSGTTLPIIESTRRSDIPISFLNSIQHNITDHSVVSHLPPSMGTSQTSQRSDRDKVIAGGPTNESIPQLCQRHQQLLEQHYRPELCKNDIGQVPRLITPSLQPIELRRVSQPLTTENCVSTGEDFSVQHTTDKSTATAVVMAAAAAAVAAQAGTLKRD